jgi:hypothetical protein
MMMNQDVGLYAPFASFRGHIQGFIQEPTVTMTLLGINPQIFQYSPVEIEHQLCNGENSTGWGKGVRTGSNIISDPQGDMLATGRHALHSVSRKNDGRAELFRGKGVPLLLGQRTHSPRPLGLDQPQQQGRRAECLYNHRAPPPPLQTQTNIYHKGNIKGAKNVQFGA